MKKTIEVQGHGRILGTPDKAVLTFSTQSHGNAPSAARTLQVTVMRKINQTLYVNGIRSNDITDSAVRLSSNQKLVDRNYVPDGYEASSSVTVRVRDLSIVDKLIDEAVAAGATHFEGPNLSVEDIRPLTDACRKAAYEDALVKARLYADASGMKLGKPVKMSEEFDYRHGSASNVIAGKAPGMSSDGSELAVGVVEVEKRLRVVFLVK